MAAVHFRHNLICWQGNFTKRGQSQRNSATNKSNVNQICSDFCCSLLKLVSLTFKTSKSASPTTQALCKGFVSLELKFVTQRPSCSIPPFPNKSPQWHISILFKCFFHFLCFPLSYFSSAAVASLSPVRIWEKHSGPDIFRHNVYYFPAVFGGWGGSSGLFLMFTTAVSCESQS